MFISPYLTSNGSIHNFSKILKAIEQSHAVGTLTECRYPAVSKLYYIDVNPETKTIPPIPLPVTVSDDRRKDEWYVVIDLRPYSSYLSRLRNDEGVIEMPDRGPVGLLFKQALLQMIWQKGEAQRLYRMTDLPISIFSTWVSETLQNKLNLNPQVQQDVKILAGWFFTCMHLPTMTADELEEEVLTKTIKLARSLKLDVAVVIELVKKVGYLEDVGALIEAIKDLGDPKAAQLNPTFFYTVLSRGWYGHASDSYTVSAALEYPPLFIGYVYAAVTESDYKNTPIATVAKRFNRNNEFENFKRILDDLFRSVVTGD